MSSEQDQSDRIEIEYQTAQDSAHHQDQLIWTTTGILWTANVIFLGFVLSGLGKDGVRLVLSVLCFLGAFLTAMVWRFSLIWREVRNRKYKVCQAIEQSGGFVHKHHTAEETAYPKGSMTKWYRVVSVVFILVWVFIAVAVWSDFK